MSANEASITFLLKLDGSQTSTELPRLTAQIASELAKLNKPNDGAAAAAITSQTALGQQTIAVQQQTNASVLKQMDALWASRDKQAEAALQKELDIERAFASQQVSTAQAAEKEIGKAFAIREKELGKSATQQLAITRQTEKEGEAIVSQSNANREKAIKTSLNNATRAASQSAASQIRSQLQTSQAAIDSNSLIEKSLTSLGDHFNLFIGHRIPIAGGAFIRLTENIKGFVAISKDTEGSVLRLGNIIAGIASKTGKPAEEIKTFLQTFATLGSQVEKDEAAVSAFGPTLAQSLVPQLARADAEMAALAASTGEVGAGMAGLAGPIGIAVLAAAALIAVLVLAEKKMFDIAAASAKVEGRFIDLSQQVGLSTEFLSAFDILAVNTGSDLGSMSAAFGIFQKHLEDAQDPMSASAGLLGELGIQTTDTETALRQTFTTLAKLPEGFRQTALALQLFGRGGKSVLAIIKETNGDLDIAIKRFRELGLIVSLEDAKAADKFNDELELLHRQVTDLTVELGKEFLPAALDIVVTLGDLIKSSRGLLDLIGFVGKPVIETFAQSLTGLSLVLAAVRRDAVETARILKDLEDRRNIAPIKIPDLTPVPLPTGEESALKRAREEARLVKAEVSEAVRFAESQIAAIDRQLQERAISPAAALEPIIATEKQKTEAVIKSLEAQREARAKEFTKDEQDRQKLADDIQAIDEQIANKRTEFDKFESDKRAAFRAQELQREQEHRRALAELFVSVLNDRIAAINRSAQAGISSELFAQDVTTKLLKAEFAKRKETLERERTEAAKDPALAQQINAQLADLHRERTATLSAEADKRTQILRNETQNALDLQRETLNSILRASEIVDASRIASIKSLVDLRVKSEEQAAREILRIRLAEIDRQRGLAHVERDLIDAQIKQRLDGFIKQRREIEKQLTEADAIKEPTHRNAERVRLRVELLTNVEAEIDAQKKANKDRIDADTDLNNKLRILNAERSQIEASGNREIDEKRQKDLENARRYVRELEEISDRTTDIERETAQEIIDLMELHFARRKDIIRAQRELDVTEEQLRHGRVTDSIRRQRSEVDEQIRIFEIHLKALKIGTTEEIEEHDRLIEKLEELRQKRTELARQQQAEDDFSTTRQRRVNDQADQQDREADPLGRIELAREQLEEFASALESSIVPLNQLLTDSFLSVADAIGQTVQNWVLLGETGPAVGRKILAQALANLAAEAAVNVIKETALGFATLFLNPADSAAHFTAAGLWALLGTGAALGGRAAAGDLFKQKSSSSSSTRSGSSDSKALETIVTGRNQREQQVVRHEHVFSVQSNDSHILRVLSKDYRDGGVVREFVFNDDGSL